MCLPKLPTVALDDTSYLNPHIIHGSQYIKLNFQPTKGIQIINNVFSEITPRGDGGGGGLVKLFNPLTLKYRVGTFRLGGGGQGGPHG